MIRGTEPHPDVFLPPQSVWWEGEGGRKEGGRFMSVDVGLQPVVKLLHPSMKPTNAAGQTWST